MIRGDLDKHTLEIRDIAQLRAELGRAVEIRPELPPTLEEQHTLYLQRQRALETLNEAEVLQRKTLSDLAVVLSNRDKLGPLRSSLEQYSTIEAGPSRSLIERLDIALGSVAKVLEEIARIPILEQTQSLASQFEKESETYYQLRQQQQVLSESLKREDAVRRRVLALEKIERELKQLQAERDELVQRRRTVRAEVAQMRDKIFEMRVKEAEKHKSRVWRRNPVSSEASGTFEAVRFKTV